MAAVAIIAGVNICVFAGLSVGTTDDVLVMYADRSAAPGGRAAD